MRNILMNYAPLILTIFTLLELATAILLAVTACKRKTRLAWLSLILTLGLLFDAGVMLGGHFLPADVLPVISRFRYIFHGLMVPLLLPIGAHALQWEGRKRNVIYIITAVIMAAGLYYGFAVQLERMDFAGILRYISGENTPSAAKVIESILSFGTILPLLVFGIAAVIRRKRPFVLIGGLMMFVFSALGPATGNTDFIFLISVIGEWLMVFFFWLQAFTEKDPQEL